MDAEKVIPPTEYTVSCENNINVGTTTVTITDASDGNYTSEWNFTAAPKSITSTSAEIAAKTYDKISMLLLLRLHSPVL